MQRPAAVPEESIPLLQQR